jgi:hypothetical protein
VPGPAYEPPTAPLPEPVAPAYQPPVQPAQPVYVQHPPQAPAWNPRETASKTVVVIMTIIGIFCGIPLALCAFVSCASAFTGNR